MTVVIAGVLAITNQVLKPAQTKSIELDTKTQILSAVMEINKKKDDVIGIYNSSIESFVVDINGDEVTTDAKGAPVEAEKVNVLRNFKKAPEDRMYPVYKFVSDGQLNAYIFPVYGNGLWNNIYGYVALERDLNTVKGVSFGHAQETPGLGARIADKSIQTRYVGKTIYDEQGNLVSVTMVKGETGNPADYGPHEVDGMSGATMTAKGLNAMMFDYLDDYQAYIMKEKGGNAVSAVLK